MKLSKLKDEAYDNWCRVNRIEKSIPAQNFKDEVRRTFGDLRRKETWQRALARYYAHAANLAVLDAWSLILYTLNFTPDSEYYELRHLILDEFLMFRDGLDLIRMGLEQLHADFTVQEREQANGFFEMVSEKRERQPTAFLDWRVPTLSAAAAG